MGAPPEGKGGKKGKPPPPAKSTDTQGKAKGKGTRSAAVSHVVPTEEAALNLFLKIGPDQQEDGHWKGEGIIDSVLGSQIFQTAEQKTDFLRDSPFLSTLLMLHVGRTHMPQLFGHNMKQVRQVKLGDGRTQADDIEVKMVELSEEEKAQAHYVLWSEEREGFFERVRIRMDWDDLAEQFLKEHPLSDQRAALEERVRALVALLNLNFSSSSFVEARSGAAPAFLAQSPLKESSAQLPNERSVLWALSGDPALTFGFASPGPKAIEIVQQIFNKHRTEKKIALKKQISLWVEEGESDTVRILELTEEIPKQGQLTVRVENLRGVTESNQDTYYRDVRRAFPDSRYNSLGLWIQIVDWEISRREPLIILRAMKKWPDGAFEHASDELKQDRAFVLRAVKLVPSCFCKVVEWFGQDREIVLAAVTEKANLLGLASPELQADPDFVLAAVQQNAEAVRFASPELREDRNFVLAAVQTNGWALRFASLRLQQDEELKRLASESGYLHNLDPYELL